MATLKQKTAIKKTFENLRENNPKSMGEIMIESGYKPSVAQHPDILTNSKAWEKAMSSVNFSGILKELEEQSFLKNNPDKDNCLRNKELALKVGDKLPKTGSKILTMFNTISGLEE